jgi:hypothetical protein
MTQKGAGDYGKNPLFASGRRGAFALKPAKSRRADMAPPPHPRASPADRRLCAWTGSGPRLKLNPPKEPSALKTAIKLGALG